MNKENQLVVNSKTIYLLLFANFLTRLLIALLTNLGNDEVYYVQYALYPQVSHFDHPPLVGLLIRLTTLNLELIFNDFFIRLGPLLIGTANLYLVYRIGSILKSKELGLISALICTASFYASVTVGTFILPDTPLSLFWLLSAYSFIQFINSEDKKTQWLLLFGVFVGFGLASKYQAILLWFGAGLYILIADRKELLQPRLWISIALTLLIFAPIIHWNLTSEFSGINYHSNRVGNDGWTPTLEYFFPEFIGQMFYNNPFIYVLIVISLIKLFKARVPQANNKVLFLILASLPLVLLTIGMSFFNKTLPHWSGPSYYLLNILVAYCFVSSDMSIRKNRYWNTIKAGLIFYFIIIVVALFQIRGHIIPMNNYTEVEKIGNKDFSLDMGAWVMIGEAIKETVDKDLKQGGMSSEAKILTFNWFPGAHLDYYYALPNHRDLLVMGDYTRQHEYLRINQLRGNLAIGADAYYITTSNSFDAPKPELLNKFEQVSEREVLPVKMLGKTVINVFIWRMKSLKEPIDLLQAK